MGEQILVNLELVQAIIEKVDIARKNLKITQDRQKCYIDLKWLEIEYEIGDKVFLKVSPWKGVVRFGKKDKLSPYFIGPLAY